MREKKKLPPQSTMTSFQAHWKCMCGVEQIEVGPYIHTIGGRQHTCSKGDYCYCPEPSAVITTTCNVCKRTSEFVF